MKKEKAVADTAEKMVAGITVGKKEWTDFGTSSRDRPAYRLNVYGGYVQGKEKITPRFSI